MTTKTKSNKTNKKTSACTTSSSTCSWTATQIAELINEAATPSEKGTATRRMNSYIKSRVADGADASRVESNIRSLCKRLSCG